MLDKLKKLFSKEVKEEPKSEKTTFNDFAIFVNKLNIEMDYLEDFVRALKVYIDATNVLTDPDSQVKIYTKYSVNNPRNGINKDYSFEPKIMGESTIEYLKERCEATKQILSTVTNLMDEFVKQQTLDSYTTLWNYYLDNKNFRG